MDPHDWAGPSQDRFAPLPRWRVRARKAARRPSRRTLDAATGAFRRRLAAHASVVAAALDFPFDFAPTRVGMLQADVVGRGITLMLVEN